MGTKRTDEFCKDAVRIALTNELTRKQVVDDLGLAQENDRRTCSLQIKHCT
ncbi:MAG: hypothetical protein ACI8TF_003140 [Paracoccaceae bacterium]|jgi:transposase